MKESKAFFQRELPLESTTYDFSEFWQGTFAAGRSYSINTRRYSSFYGFDIDSGSGGKVALSTFPETEYDNKVVDIKLSGGFNTGNIFHQVIDTDFSLIVGYLCCR